MTFKTPLVKKPRREPGCVAVSPHSRQTHLFNQL